MSRLVRSPYALSLEENEKAKIALSELDRWQIEEEKVILINYQIKPDLMAGYDELTHKLLWYIGLRKRDALILDAVKEKYAKDITAQELEHLVENSGDNLKARLEEWIIFDLTSGVMHNLAYGQEVRQIIGALYNIDSDENERFHVHVNVGIYSLEEQEPLRAVNDLRRKMISKWEQFEKK